MSSEQILIYGLRDPVDGRIKYVGQTQNPKTRLDTHLTLARTGKLDPKSRWIASLLQAGLKPVAVILAVATDSNCREMEEKWLASARSEGDVFNVGPCARLRRQDHRARRERQREQSVTLALVRSLPATGRSEEDVQKTAREWRWRHLARAAIVAITATKDEGKERC